MQHMSAAQRKAYRAGEVVVKEELEDDIKISSPKPRRRLSSSSRHRSSSHGKTRVYASASCSYASMISVKLGALLCSQEATSRLSTERKRADLPEVAGESTVRNSSLLVEKWSPVTLTNMLFSFPTRRVTKL